MKIFGMGHMYLFWYLYLWNDFYTKFIFIWAKHKQQTKKCPSLADEDLLQLWRKSAICRAWDLPIGSTPPPAGRALFYQPDANKLKIFNTNVYKYLNKYANTGIWFKILTSLLQRFCVWFVSVLEHLSFYGSSDDGALSLQSSPSGVFCPT